MDSRDKVEVNENAAHFMQLVQACRVLGDMQVIRIRNASTDDLVAAMAAARAINAGIGS